MYKQCTAQQYFIDNVFLTKVLIRHNIMLIVGKY